MDAKEAAEEFLLCCRYGELEDALKLLESGVDIDTQDAAGGTALHLACANGHDGVVAMLVARGARHLANTTGNTPLHWAVMNRHRNCVRVLLEGLPDSARMDVLTRNEFGKSAISEGFAAGDPEIVRLILEHQSAEDDMLGKRAADTDPETAEKLAETAAQMADEGVLPSISSEGAAAGAEADAAAGADDMSGVRESDAGHGGGSSSSESDDDDEEEAEILHEFGFGECRAPLLPAAGTAAPETGRESGVDSDSATPLSLEVRELAIRDADNPFGSEPSQDQTGLGIWAAAIVMARWMASPAVSRRMQGASVVELGAGCGVSGLSAAVHARPRSLLLTDVNAETLANLAHNVALNRARFRAAAPLPAAAAAEISAFAVAGDGGIGRPRASSEPAAESPASGIPPAGSGSHGDDVAAPNASAGSGSSDNGGVAAPDASAGSGGSDNGGVAAPNASAGSGGRDNGGTSVAAAADAASGQHVSVASLDWSDSSTWPSDPPGGFDVVLGCDLIYHKLGAPLLANAVAGCCRRGGTFLYASPDGGRDGLAEFFAALALRGFSSVACTRAPDAYKENPLLSGSEGDYLLYFMELHERPYLLHEFRRRADGEAAPV